MRGQLTNLMRVLLALTNERPADQSDDSVGRAHLVTVDPPALAEDAGEEPPVPGGPRPHPPAHAPHLRQGGRRLLDF